MPTEPTHTPLKAVHLMAELKRAESGLDCAGMSESMRVADYASDLESGHPIDDVWAMMCARYLPDNAGFLLSFLAAYQEDRKAIATRAPSPVTALRSAPGGWKWEVARTCQHLVGPNGGLGVSMQNPQRIKEPELRADAESMARLIASAPVLLAALQKAGDDAGLLCAAMETHNAVSDPEEHIDAEFIGMLEKIRDNARTATAIAAATREGANVL